MERILADRAGAHQERRGRGVARHAAFSRSSLGIPRGPEEFSPGDTPLPFKVDSMRVGSTELKTITVAVVIPVGWEKAKVYYGHA